MTLIELLKTYKTLADKDPKLMVYFRRARQLTLAAPKIYKAEGNYICGFTPATKCSTALFTVDDFLADDWIICNTVNITDKAGGDTSIKTGSVLSSGAESFVVIDEEIYRLDRATPPAPLAAANGLLLLQ